MSLIHPQPHEGTWAIWKKTNKIVTELVKKTTDYAMYDLNKKKCVVL